jgi:hypothetical protein
MGSSLPPSRGDPNAVAAPTGPATEAAAPERAESPARRSSGPSSLQDRRTAGGLPGKETGWGFFSCGNDVRLGRNDTDFAGRMRLFYVWDPRSSANILSKILNSQNGYIPGPREYILPHTHCYSQPGQCSSSAVQPALLHPPSYYSSVPICPIKQHNAKTNGVFKKGTYGAPFFSSCAAKSMFGSQGLKLA